MNFSLVSVFSSIESVFEGSRSAAFCYALLLAFIGQYLLLKSRRRPKHHQFPTNLKVKSNSDELGGGRIEESRAEGTPSFTTFPTEAFDSRASGHWHRSKDGLLVAHGSCCVSSSLEHALPILYGAWDGSTTAKTFRDVDRAQKTNEGIVLESSWRVGPIAGRSVLRLAVGPLDDFKGDGGTRRLGIR